MSDSDRMLVATPVTKKFPCGTCKHLRPTAHSQYAECTYVAPVLAYWQYPPAAPSTWRNTKYIYGPHTADAEPVVCPAWEGK